MSRQDPHPGNNIGASMLRGARRAAWLAFFEARDALAEPTPCEVTPSDWDAPEGIVTREDMKIAAAAAATCLTCPLLAQCRLVAFCDEDIGGVVAGEIRFRRRGREKTTAKKAGHKKKEKDK